MIYTIDFKAVLDQFIQWWLRELTWIDDVVIPCPLLLLDFLPPTPPEGLGLYILAPTPHPRAISKTLIHISHSDQHTPEGLGLELSNVED
jgi:hypothetical protein